MGEKRRSWGERAAGIAGIAFGLVLVALAVSTWTIPAGNGSLGADVFFSSGLTGELAVSPTGPFLHGAGLKPGDEARGTLQLRNQTGARLAVRVRALPDRPDLDSVLRVEVYAGSKRLFSGRLGRLTHPSPGALLLAPGAQGELRFRAWLPARIKTGYEGRMASVPFELQARPAR